MKILSLVLFPLILTGTLKSNDPQKEPSEHYSANGYFRTYDDFIAHHLEKMDECEGSMHIMNTIYIAFKSSGSRKKIKCADIWGFKCKNQLFRIDHNKYEDDPCAVMSSGKIAYYENGGNHLKMLLDSANYGNKIFLSSESGHMYYFSETLNSEMISVSNPKQYRAFKSKYQSKYPKLFDCIDNTAPSLTVFYDCARKYNQSEKEIDE